MRDLRRNSLAHVLRQASTRRHAIVQRGDRLAPGEERQEMTFSYAQQSVDTLGHVCVALDELVHQHLLSLRRREEAADAAG